MEPMKRININSHFELIPAEKLKEYGGRIVQIMLVAEIKHWEDHVFLCEVEKAPDFPVYVSELNLDDLVTEKRDERVCSVTEEEQHEKTD